ncbi:MAG: prefoldin subunit beta [Methanophagales archaeon]|nr:prefoldin subunit beta [Methanophagales archaeon]
MSGSAEISPQVQNLFVQLQQLKAQLEASMRQKVQAEGMVRDIENALKELEKVDKNTVIYKTVGELMLKASKDEVMEDLAEKKETYSLRWKTLERQEERSQKRYQQLQQQLQESLGTVMPPTAAT